LDWGKIKFFLGEVFRNFTRNAGMQATAIGTVAVTIVLLGAFLYARASLVHFGNDLMQQITVSVYVNPDATQAQEDTLRMAFAKDLRIEGTEYIPKRDGLKELEQRMRGQVDVSSFLTENPLPDKFRIKVRNPEFVSAVAGSIKKLPGVQSVDYGQDVVQRLLQLGNVARRVGIALIAVFVLVAGIIISNTIRLTVFARRREISIMQLVGATNMYIRMPFICEGLIDGTLGAALAVGLLVLARVTLMPKLALALPWLQLNAAHIDLSSLLLQLFAVGAAVGVVASWIAVGRYLRT
jgi:cell division transport system permease protein